MDEKEKNAKLYREYCLRPIPYTQASYKKYLEKLYGSIERIQSFPHLRTIHTYVEWVRDLKVDQHPGIKEIGLKQKEEYLEKLLSCLEDYLENLEYEKLNVFGEIFKKAVTESRENSMKSSYEVKAEWAIVKFRRKYKDKEGVSLDDLFEFLGEDERRNRKSYRRVIPKLGYTLKDDLPGPKTKRK